MPTLLVMANPADLCECADAVGPGAYKGRVLGRKLGPAPRIAEENPCMIERQAPIEVKFL